MDANREQNQFRQQYEFQQVFDLFYLHHIHPNVLSPHLNGQRITDPLVGSFIISNFFRPVKKCGQNDR